jgi:hypothetical protein
MAQHLRVDLSSLTAMRYTVAGLQCVPQSMQGCGAQKLITAQILAM